MRVVNLARDPYLNHRPVVRVSVVLWVIGGVLLVVNGWLYWSHWNGVGRNQDLLQGIEASIQEQESKLREGRALVSEVDIWSENSRTKYVNALISQRRFPWSDLFQALEEVLPTDIKLTGVQPSVNLANDPEKVSQKRPPQRRRSRRRQAPPQPVAKPVPVVDKPDEVVLKLSGSARKEEALMDFVDALYQNPAFLKPHLSSETLDSNRGSSDFLITVVYLLSRTPTSSPEVVVAEQEPDTVVVGDPERTEIAGADDDGQEPVVLPSGESDDPTQPERATVADTTVDSPTARTRADNRPAGSERVASTAEEGTSAPASRGGRVTTGQPGVRVGTTVGGTGRRQAAESESPQGRRSSTTNRETRRGPTEPENRRPGSNTGGSRSPTTKRPNASDNPRIGGGGGGSDVAHMTASVSRREVLA